MVVGTIAAVAIISTGGAAVAPMAAAGASVGGAAGSTAAVIGTGSAVATSVGVGVSGGAVAGAGVAAAVKGATAGSVAAGAVVGGLSGGATAAGVGGSGAGFGAVVATAGTGGLGLILVGASVNQDDDEVTFDCWKTVVHDTSPERSNGMLLRDMVDHPCVAKVSMAPGISDDLPSIILENIWNERFEIEYVLLRKSGKIACHVIPLCE